MYSKGPKTDPWGTPKGAGSQRDLDDPTTAQLVRPVRKEESQSKGLPVSPKETARRLSKIEWSTESNAELTSKLGPIELSDHSPSPKEGEPIKSRWNDSSENPT